MHVAELGKERGREKAGAKELEGEDGVREGGGGRVSLQADPSVLFWGQSLPSFRRYNPLTHEQFDDLILPSHTPANADSFPLARAWGWRIGDLLHRLAVVGTQFA